MLWTLWFTYPFMMAIQIVSARIARVSGHGIATNIRKFYPAWLLYGIVLLLCVANTINIAADLAAMGEALKLLVGGPALVYVIGFGLVSLFLQIWVPYRNYVRVLKWMTLALFAYVGTVFAVHIPWLSMIKSTLFPHLYWKKSYLMAIVAVFGTTISPYLFFWQASEEVEDQLASRSEHPIIHAPELANRNFSRINFDTAIGLGFSNLVAFFIVLTTAVTLHTHQVTHIQTAAQAAAALIPTAGKFAFFLFSLGIIGTGLLAIPVLAGSSAYAMAGAFRWRNSLELKPKLAKRFYGIIGMSVLIAISLCFSPINPMKALYWSAVINGMISVPIIILMMHMATNPKIMGEFTIGNTLKILGWGCALIMGITVLLFFTI